MRFEIRIVAEAASEADVHLFGKYVEHAGKNQYVARVVAIEPPRAVERYPIWEESTAPTH